MFSGKPGVPRERGVFLKISGKAGEWIEEKSEE
jgi:hypothetical protein